MIRRLPRSTRFPYTTLFRSHTLGHLDTEQGHGVLDGLGHVAGQYQTHDTLLIAIGIENTIIVVELVKLLRQLVAVVGYAAGTVVLTGLLHGSAKLAELLYKLGFLGIEPYIACQHARKHDMIGLGLTHYAANTGVSILNEGACVAIEVNTFLGIKEHILTCIDLQDKVFQRTQDRKSCRERV